MSERILKRDRETFGACRATVNRARLKYPTSVVSALVSGLASRNKWRANYSNAANRSPVFTIFFRCSTNNLSTVVDVDGR